MMWIVIRRDEHRVPADYHIQGLATSEQIAIEMCVDETYFIGPLPVNTSLPHSTIEWIGLYFPKQLERGSVEIATVFFICLIGSLILAFVSFLGFIFQSAEINNTIANVWLLANVVFSIINAFVIWRSKHREEERIALEKLLNVRTMERDQAEKERDNAKEEATRLKTEYTVLAGIKITELIKTASKEDY